MLDNNVKPDIIFIDLDGTLLDVFNGRHHYVSAENKDIIKELNKTIPIVISTGRGPTKRTKEIVSDIELDTYISWNGAQIVKNNEVILKLPISKEINQKLFDDIKKWKMCAIYNSDPKKTSYASNWLFKLVMKFGKRSAKKYFEFHNDFEAFKIFLWSPRKKTVLNFYEKISKKYKNYLNVCLSGRRNEFIEVTSIFASKGLSAKRYCELNNLNPKNAIHLGDSLNDASTKNVLGLLVGFSNGNNEFKKYADYINDFPHSKGGVAKYLKRFL